MRRYIEVLFAVLVLTGLALVFWQNKQTTAISVEITTNELILPLSRSFSENQMTLLKFGIYRGLAGREPNHPEPGLDPYTEVFWGDLAPLQNDLFELRRCLNSVRSCDYSIVCDVIGDDIKSMKEALVSTIRFLNYRNEVNGDDLELDAHIAETLRWYLEDVSDIADPCS